MFKTAFLYSTCKSQNETFKPYANRLTRLLEWKHDKLIIMWNSAISYSGILQSSSTLIEETHFVGKVNFIAPQGVWVNGASDFGIILNIKIH